MINLTSLKILVGANFLLVAVFALQLALPASSVLGSMSQPWPQENARIPDSTRHSDAWRSNTLAPQNTKVFIPRLDRAVGPPNYFLPHREPVRPRVGLALSGGGARALFQIGVLQALEEYEVPIDFIAGTSMGSVVGGLYAAGYSVKQLRETARTIQWQDITVDTPPRTSLFLAQRQERERAFLQIRFQGLKPYIPPAITAGQKLLTVLTDLTMRANYQASMGFDHLRIPFRTVATDLYSGKEIIIADGDLAEAMRASLAVPFLFAPLPRGGMLLADGGLLNNIPVDVARRYADVVIAVDATSKLRDKDHLNMPWEMADQITTIMQREQTQAQRQRADVVITLDAPTRTSSDFSAIDSLIDTGYRKTLEQIDKIRTLARGQPTEQLFSHGSAQVFAINFLVLHNNESLQRPALSDTMPHAEKGLPRDITFGLPQLTANQYLSLHGDSVGVMLTAEEIQKWVEAVYATGQYATVHAEIRADSLMLVVHDNPRLGQVHFSGNTVFPDSTLLSCMQSRPGEVINHHRSARDLVAIVERYRNDGYALAEIRDVKFDTSTGLLHIDIDEGRIGEIEIEGINRTKNFVVLREFPQKPGDIFHSGVSSRGVRNIYSTGLFDQVMLNIRRGANGAIVKIKVREKPFRVLRVGGRYDTERDTRGFLEMGDENAFGTGSKVFAYQEIGTRDQLSRVAFRNDRILKTYFSLSANAYYHKRENFVYRNLQRDAVGEYLDDRLGLHLVLGQQMRRIGAVSAELRFEEVNLKALKGSGYPTGNSTLNAIILRSVVDTRDRLPFPRHGRYVHAFYENVYSELGAKDSFFRMLMRMETFHSRGPHTLHPKLSIGASDQTTPFSEQFRLGGPDEVYGLREQELIGRHFTLGSLEYRYEFRRRPIFDLYFGLRYDFSGLWIDRRDTNYRKFHHAFGLSLACVTPLGPLSIAYGRYENLRQSVYVSMGYSF
ncbi:MAG: patatin-like phospholipase family protein [candidate division KSB1 bacterium]|nr:patatin-like phospholipase family protein [candidate division KSB1 bacterium]MDZ7311185.1 patatin-like phospholipase family protein [candidate division KSB1 bacterium]